MRLPWQRYICRSKYGCFCSSPQVTYLHTKNEGGLKFFISNFASLSWRIALNMSRSSKVRKFSCRVLDYRYIFLIFISRQNKLVGAQRAPKKITRFVPLRVHLLEIRRLGSWNTLPTRRSGIFSSSSYFLHDKCLYL